MQKVHYGQLVILVLWASTWLPSEGRIEVNKGPFLRLPDAGNAYRFNSGTADKAAYDYQEHYLYVVGHLAGVLHVVDLHIPDSPRLLTTKSFNKVSQGQPNSVKVCRSQGMEGFLAVTFESPTRNHKGHVHFYKLMDANTVHSSLHLMKDVMASESFDPRAIAWTPTCNELVVVSEGSPHEINNLFDDPPPHVEVFTPSFGTSVIRRDVPIVGSKAENAELRQVFTNCDSGSAMNQTSTFLQNMEPNAVHVDANNTAYILFQSNNGIAKLKLDEPFASLEFFSFGTKDWSGLSFDGSYDDGGFRLARRKIRSFYQPKDMVSFELGGKMWLATADTGVIRRYSLPTCRFDESVIAMAWRQRRLYVTKLKTSTDGWDSFYQGYDYVTMYGGRGFSILDPKRHEQGL